ncbi:ferritin, partial [Conidiobolus coronatus NRRL 28638]
MEYRASFVYASMAAYFDRDNISLPGLAKFFRKSSHEERDHAEMLTDYLNKRGGRVQLFTVEGPQVEFDSAVAAVQLALQLEKDVNKSLLNLHKIADEHNDPQMCDFIESEFLNEQVDGISQLANYVTQLNRVAGDGLGLYLWDQNLLKSL